MKSSETDWKSHMEQYEASGLTMDAYCEKYGLNVKTFRNKRYTRFRTVRPRPACVPAFKEFKAGVEVTVTLDRNGRVGIKGINPRCLPEVLRVICAVSK